MRTICLRRAVAATVLTFLPTSSRTFFRCASASAEHSARTRNLENVVGVRERWAGGRDVDQQEFGAGVLGQFAGRKHAGTGGPLKSVGQRMS
jgi:hypothetical protein